MNKKIGFCKWFYDTSKEGMKVVSLFLMGCLGIYILFLMLTPFLPLFSNLPLTEYEWWLHLALYIEVCLFSVLGLISYLIVVELYIGYVKDVKGKKIVFKVKPQWVVYTVTMIIVFTYVGYNGGYETGVSEGFGKGVDYASSIGISDWDEWADLQSKKTMFENWGNFLVTYDNESHILETYSYSDGMVIITITNEHNLTIYSEDWNGYNEWKNGWVFDTSPGTTTIHTFNFDDYPNEVFCIIVYKEINPFPYDYKCYQGYGFDPVKRTFEVET
jgi:hypothetical protein